eukprot:CAMPEP_0196597546 /NCGR_PEP_ID=MMETSP1081-20130531/91953_1 /TAXON_ID=36882 /ORGANISM="Pyramimonas amylifera, Strain CCMP720" /LENGTH=312 /DNA_ID=CAMNT_0041922987 /DNA_START=122 /DNA_END=1060 /DNA_ORIENTATION=-
MTVVALKCGGLWVHSPVAPTLECLAMLADIQRTHGPIKYIIHPTYALEHKVFVGAFAQQFPTAEVWVAPGQESFPLPKALPVSWQLGIPFRKINTLDDSRSTPWADEIEQITVGPFPLQIGAFVEVVFFHMATSTLLVTDLVGQAGKTAPEVCLEDPAPLLYLARDTADQLVKNSPDLEQAGWLKTLLLALYIKPSTLDLVDNGFSWFPEYRNSALEMCGRLVVAPLLSVFLINRYPFQVLEVVDRISQWNFTQIIPGHFEGPVPTNPKKFRQAFEFLEMDGSISQDGLRDEEMEFLRSANKTAVDNGLIKG